MGLHDYNRSENITSMLPSTPALVFEGDIYKSLVWQLGESWLFYLPDLSCVTKHMTDYADKSDRARTD